MGSGPRHLGAVAAVTGLALAIPGSALAAKGFTDGVSAGEIGKHGATIWGRAIHRGPVRAEVATDDAFRHLADHRAVRARKRNDKTVQIEIDGLDPNRTYRYRFCFKGTHRCSSTGRFQTAPRASDPKTIRFAYSGDETGVSAPGQQKPFWGNFKAFKTMAGEHNDFNIDFGDTIYSDPEVPGAAIARTVQQKWGMYRKKLAVQNMRRIRATTGIYNHWDDHEFINDFSIAEDGRQLYRRSVRAFRDYMPVTYNRKRGIYRSFRWGKNLEMFFLDERSFRSAKASAGGTCDNPDTGQPDLAPTAPQSTRNVFAAVIPSLSQPVSQACKDKLNSPNRTFLGKAQRHRFLHAVETSNAKWKVVMNETPIQQFYGLPFDRWEGYAYERLRVLNSLVNHDVDHLVFLTTDTHAAFANVVRKRSLAGDVAPTNAPAQPADTPYQDFIIGPVATRPFWQEIDAATGRSGNGKLLSTAFFKPPPPSGVGMECAQGDQNSYAEVTVKSGTLKVAYKDENGDTVVDVNGTTPCGPYVLHG